MSNAPSAQAVKQLREKTGAGIMECKSALVESNGNEEKAIETLRKKGIAVAQKKSSRATKEGLIHSYIHMGGKIGVMVELGCETDFVAKNSDFQAFATDIAMHIAAANPLYLAKEDIPADFIEKEKDIFKEQLKDKPENVMEKILEGKVAKIASEVCLLEQAYIKDDKISISDYLTATIARIGENIVIRRFVRYALGEENK